MKYLSYTLFITAMLLQAAFAFKVEEKHIYSQVMNREIPAIFILPDSYSDSTTSFPVVYLLHGYGGNYRNWVDRTTVEDLADVYNIILVCPDGSKDSWYFDSPIDPDSRYETHIAIEVVKFTDRTYRTVKSRSGRAITGLSMGGHGALFLAIRHPEVFGAAGSMSGGVDIRGSKKRWNISQKIGSYEAYPQRWESLSVINNIPKFKSAQLSLIVDCGVDDFFIGVNRAFHQKLLDAHVPHDYIERPGAHNWQYWNKAVRFQILFFAEFFKQGQ